MNIGQCIKHGCVAFLALTFFSGYAIAQDGQKSSTVQNQHENSRSAQNKSSDKKTKTKTKKSRTASEKQVDSVSRIEDSLKKLSQAFAAEQYASALTYCEQAMNDLPEDFELSRKISLYELCFSLYQRNEKYEEALTLSKKITEIATSQDVIDRMCFNEATTLTKLHRWEMARKRYEDCPGNTDVERAFVESNVAELWMIEENSSAAVEEYRRSIELYDENPHSRFGLAVALSRLDKWDEARKAFLDGVSLDPGFTFLTDAFFEPLCENDYQTAYRLYELGRYRDAKYYLERYVKTEERAAYRQQAQRFLERISSAKAPLLMSYPVLTQDVRAMAVNADGSKIVLSSFEWLASDINKSILWVIDTVREKVYKRTEIPEQMIIALAFVDSSKLKLTSPYKRYELNVDEVSSGYYVFDNSPNSYVVGVTANGEDLVGVTVDGKVTMSPWEDPWLLAGISEVSLNTKKIRISSDHTAMIVMTTISTFVINIVEDRIERKFSQSFKVSSIAVHPSKKVFALGTQKGTILVNEKGEITAMYGADAAVDSLVFDATGNRLAALSGNQLEIWDVSGI